MKEKQKWEASERMKLLNLGYPIIKEFEESGKVYVSKIAGKLVHIEDEKVLEKIQWLEKKCYVLVYHVIKTTTTFGIVYSIFFILEEEEEWVCDREEFERYEALVYTYIVDNDHLSGIRCIEYTDINGGLAMVEFDSSSALKWKKGG